jgi:hypothetical protein
MTLDLKAVEARLDRADIGDYPHDDAMDDVADLLAALREHRDLLRKIAAKHQGCDDGFYACPRSEDYFGQYVDDEVPVEKRPCSCWAERAAAVLAKVRDE